MKKRIVAMFLGGMLAAGSLAMQTPVTAWAVNQEGPDGSDISDVETSESGTETPDAASKTDSSEAPTAETGTPTDNSGSGNSGTNTSGESGGSGSTDMPNENNGTNTSDEGSGNSGTDTQDKDSNNGDTTKPSDGADNSGSDDTSDSITLEECGEDSWLHIKNYEITTSNGQITVAVDIKCENKSSSGVDIYRLDKELDKDKLDERDPEDSVGYNYLYAELKRELEAEGEPSMVDHNVRQGWIRWDEESYTFTGLANGKTQYIYAEVADWHQYQNDHDGGDALHSAVYLGSIVVGSNASTNVPSDSSSSDNGSSDSSASASIPRDYTREAEEKMLGQITAAPAASTVTLDKGITALSNSVMKELLERGDVSVKLDFTYMGQKYVIVIPAGEALDSDIPWYGPLYLAQHYGNRAETTGLEVYAKGTGAELVSQIKGAPSTAVVVMEKGVMTLSNSVMKELQKKGDVSLRLEFTYGGEDYVITIPAGATLEDDIPWYGPLYLIQHFGNSAEMTD